MARCIKIKFEFKSYFEITVNAECSGSDFECKGNCCTAEPLLIMICSLLPFNRMILSFFFEHFCILRFAAN